MSVEPAVGVHALRTFQVEELSGSLLPVTPDFGAGRSNRRAYFAAWARGECIAQCWVNPAHEPPVDGCSCGIYSFRDLRPLREQYVQAMGLVGVVALEGRAIEGDQGWRTQAARVVALWAAPDLLTAAVRKRLRRRLPRVRWFADLDEMTAAYPGIGSTRSDEHPPPDDTYALRKSIVFLSSSGAFPDDSERRISLRMLKALLWR